MTVHFGTFCDLSYRQITVIDQFNPLLIFLFLSLSFHPNLSLPLSVSLSVLITLFSVFLSPNDSYRSRTRQFQFWKRIYIFKFLFMCCNHSTFLSFCLLEYSKKTIKRRIFLSTSLSDRLIDSLRNS